MIESFLYRNPMILAILLSIPISALVYAFSLSDWWAGSAFALTWVIGAELQAEKTLGR